jgi:hypothetical protein
VGSGDGADRTVSALLPAVSHKSLKSFPVRHVGERFGLKNPLPLMPPSPAKHRQQLVEVLVNKRAGSLFRGFHPECSERAAIVVLRVRRSGLSCVRVGVTGTAKKKDFPESLELPLGDKRIEQ